MSLDVSLYITKPRKSKIRRDGKRVTYSEIYDALGIEDRELEFKDVCVFKYNITHNLGKMAEAAGIYKHIWRPEDIGISFVCPVFIKELKEGLDRLQSNPAQFAEFTPSNGWGSYDGLVDFVKSYIVACEEFPEAKIHISR
jgi:hypothetical protein